MIRKMYSVYKKQGFRDLNKKILSKIFRQYSIDEVRIISNVLYQICHFNSGGGVMIDVGAHYGSTLKKFADNGWIIYAFEPDRMNRKILLNNIGNYKNVIVDDRGCSNKNQNDVPFYTSTESTGISGLSKFVNTHKEAYKVNLVRLKTYIKQHKIDKVDFLKIDTEGFDLFVLEGFPFETHLPSVIICEFEDNKTIPLGYETEQLANYLIDKGYKLIVSEWYPITKYGIEHIWKDFYEYGDKDIGKNGWGNFIACKYELYEPIVIRFKDAKEKYEKSKTKIKK